MSYPITQAFQFSLQYAAAAAANGNGTYGPAFQFPAVKTLTLTITYISDKAEGNSILVALASQIISVDFQIDGANLSFQIMGLLTGQTPTYSNPGTISEVDTITFTNALMPYFGIVCQAWGQNGDDMCFLLPYAKVMTGFNWKFDYGKFAVPQFKGTCISEPSLAYIIQGKTHATKIATPAFPPSWA